ncbi:MAG: ATP-binding cassette domain-containing protein [Flammeovirgaceae bacterium]
MSIVVECLTKKYGAQTAVDNISFEIKTGEVVGFLGPNGAGKSTTMKIITGFMTANEGDVRLNNFSVREQPEEVKKRIGYLPEHNPLYLDMAIADYLRFSAEIQGVEKSIIGKRVKEMVERCGLTPERYKKIGQLSKGFRQRVGLAQALIHNPEVLILDEPTTGLDPNQIIEIRKLIKELGKEKTVILSSHILSEVEATCDRILIINKGKIVADGTANTLRTQAQGKEMLTVGIEAPNLQEIQSALLELPTVESLKALESKNAYFQIVSKPDMSSRKQIFELCVKKNWYLTELHGTETSLEDVFRELTN